MILCDLHTHTVASGHAYSTVLENAAAAKRRGLSVLAITDHGPAVPGASTDMHFHAASHIPEMIDGVRILFGVEANIMDTDGQLDLDDDLFRRLGFVIAGLHKDAGRGRLDRDAATAAVVAAVRHPRVNMISHPYGLDYEVDLDAVAQAAAKHGTLLELNASRFYLTSYDLKAELPRMQAMVAAAKRYGARLALGSDAHIATSVGRFDEIAAYFPQLGITEADLINSDPAALLALIGQ